MVNSCRTFTFIGCHFPYRQNFGFKGRDKKMLQGFHLVVSSCFLSLCYSDLQLPYLLFASCEVYSFPHGLASGWRCTLGLRLVPLLFPHTWSSTIRFTKNYPVEVCPLSRRVTLKPLSMALHHGIRFLHNPLPASHSAALTIGLPIGYWLMGEIRAYQVSHK